MPKARRGQGGRGRGGARGGRGGRGGRRGPMTRGEHLAQAAQVEQVEQVEQAEQVEQGEQVEQAGTGRPSPSNVGTAPSNVGSAGIGGEHDGQSHSNIVIPNAPPSNHVLARTGDRPVNGLGDLGFQGFPVYDAGHGNMNSYGGRQLGAPLGVFVPLTLRGHFPLAYTPL